MTGRIGLQALVTISVVLIVSALFLGPTIDQYFLWNGEFERSLSNFWNLGHLILFAAASLAAFFFGLPRKALWISSAFLVLFLIGLLIEFVQSKVGRSASAFDIVQNFIGLVLGFALGFISRSKIAWLVVVLLVFVELLLFKPFFRDFIDELNARDAFPVLADFSNDRQRSRFVFSNSLAEMSRSRLHVTFLPSEYSSFELKFFPANWSLYNRLYIRVDNTSQESYGLHCRLHDRAHQMNGLQYRDRFNTEFQLRVGKSEFSVNLIEAQHGPESRLMDLQRMRSLLCFTHNIDARKTLDIEKIWLAK